MAERRVLSVDEWRKEAEARFGPDEMKWSFVCPSCGHVQTTQDYKDAGAPVNAVAFSCVGRWLESAVDMCVRPGPCNYAGGGLFKINPVTVITETGERDVFEFSEGVGGG